MEDKQSIVRVSTGGVFNSIDDLARAIKALGEKHNILVPGGAIGGELPLLHAVGLSFVFINPENETYRIPGKTALGISKSALDRISAAAGVRWNPHLCGRTDDGSNPHVVEYQAAGTVLQLDGTERMIHASKRIDLRAERETSANTWGSDAQEIARIAEKADPPREPWPQILQQRQHILSLAESKAKNRAIRSLGVRTAYEPAELAKGFVVLRLQFTGRSDDPEVEREVSFMIARRALSSSNMLYGAETRRELAPGPLPKAVPKIASKDEDADEEEDKGQGPDPASAPAPAAKPPAETRPNGKTSSCPPDDPPLICGDKDDDGKWPRKPCSQFTVPELRAKIAAYEKKQPDWDPKWAAKNEAELKAMKAWLAFKEFDPRQGSLNMGATGKDDKVAY